MNINNNKKKLWYSKRTIHASCQIRAKRNQTFNNTAFIFPFHPIIPWSIYLFAFSSFFLSLLPVILIVSLNNLFFVEAGCREHCTSFRKEKRRCGERISLEKSLCLNGVLKEEENRVPTSPSAQHSVFKRQLWEKPGISAQDKHKCAFQSAPLNISHISPPPQGFVLSLASLYFPHFFPSITPFISAEESPSRAISHPLSVWLWLTHSILLHLCGCFWHGDSVWLTAALTVTTLPASLWPGVGISGQLDESETQAVRWTAARLQPLISLFFFPLYIYLKAVHSQHISNHIFLLHTYN